MKLLFDHNLSPALVSQLTDLFPGANHVYLLGLHEATDKALWQFAREQDYTIVTRDVDFSELTVLLGSPPKIVWIRRGNCSTREVEALLRRHHEAIEGLESDASAVVLTLI